MMKNMRQRARTIAVAAVCALALTACSDAAEDTAGVEATGDGEAGTSAKLINDGEFVVAMSGEFKPFSHFDDNNELTGFDFDIAGAIADELGLTLKAETASLGSLIQGLQSSRYDALVASMSATEERMNAVDFTEPYYTDGASYFVPNDSDCEAFDMEADLKVGVANGTTYDKFLRDGGFEGEVVTFESDFTALQDTEAGRLDGTVTGKLVGLYQIQEASLPLRECGDSLYSEGPAIAVAKENPLKDDINDALEAIKDDGTYAEISEKWFGEDIS